MQFLLTNAFLLAVGIMLYLVVRTLPRIEEGAETPERHTVFERIVMSDIPHRLDATVNTFLGKVLRKTKIYLMRTDNYLTGKLKTMNMKNGNGKNGDHTEYIKELNGPLEEAVEEEDNKGVA